MSNTQEKLVFENDLYQRGEQSLRVIKHALRQKMIGLIHKNGTMPVTDIYRKMKIEQSTASSHLAVLRKEGYLNRKKVERFVFYSVNYEKIREAERIARVLAAVEQE